MIRINKIITKLIKNVDIDKITHFFAGATIALSVTLILCLVGSISRRAKLLVAGAGYMGGRKPYQNGGKVNK